MITRKRTPLRVVELLLAAILTIIGVLVAFAGPAAAAAQNVVVAPPDAIVHVDVAFLALVSGSFIPLFTALATKLDASSKVKATVNLILSITAGVVAAFVAGDGTLSTFGIIQAGISAYLASGVTYSNLWKPSGIAPALQERTASVGLGATFD